MVMFGDGLGYWWGFGGDWGSYGLGRPLRWAGLLVGFCEVLVVMGVVMG